MKDLTVILSVPEVCPPDFHVNPIYMDQVKQAIEIANSLVYEINDEGRAKARSDVAAINKFVRSTDGFTKSVFETVTSKWTKWRQNFTTETKQLKSIGVKIMDNFNNMEESMISANIDVVYSLLGSERDRFHIRDEFIKSYNLKITTTGWITDKGSYTKKTKDLVESIIADELAMQNTYDKRCNVVKIRCLEEGMIPFSPDVIGEAMFTKSEDVFLLKLQKLIDLEIVRIEKQKEKQAKERDEAIAAALKKQQIESDRIARDNAKTEMEVAKTSESAERSKDAADERAASLRAKDAQIPDVSGTHIVRYTLVFQARVKNTTTNEAFKSMIDRDIVLSDRAKKAIFSALVESI